MEKSPWKETAPSLLIVYSILAAISGVALFFVLSDNIHYPNYWWTVPVISLAISSYLFIYSGEQITDALDEDDVYKLIYLYSLYNIAVILFIGGIISTIYIRYFLTIPFCFRTHWKIISLFLCIFIFVTFRWICNLKWLIFSSNRTYKIYAEELMGIRIVTEDHGWQFKLFMWLRKRLSKKDSIIRFADIIIELKPSRIDGIGVFAAKAIQKNEIIAEGVHKNDYNGLVSWEEAKHLPISIKEKINNFCIGTPNGFFPPPNFDFNKLSIDWFMNHSCKGDVGFNKDGDFITMRDIKKGEELTYDYGLAESNPNFKMECSCGNSNCRKIITGNDWKDDAFKISNLEYLLPELR